MGSQTTYGKDETTWHEPMLVKNAGIGFYSLHVIGPSTDNHYLIELGTELP